MKGRGGVSVVLAIVRTWAVILSVLLLLLLLRRVVDGCVRAGEAGRNGREVGIHLVSQIVLR